MRNVKIETFVKVFNMGEITVRELRQLSGQIGMAPEQLLEAGRCGNSEDAARILGVDRDALEEALAEIWDERHSIN